MLGGKEHLKMSNKDEKPEQESEVEEPKKVASTDDLIAAWYRSRGSGGWTGD
jgi:hypothetical protein